VALPLTVLFGQWLGLLAYALGVAGRVVAARATGARALPGALAHPVWCCFSRGCRALVPPARPHHLEGPPDMAAVTVIGAGVGGLAAAARLAAAGIG